MIDMSKKLRHLFLKPTIKNHDVDGGNVARLRVANLLLPPFFTLDYTFAHTLLFLLPLFFHVLGVGYVLGLSVY